MPLNVPAVTAFTLESGPPKIWHAWLSSYFDGGAHPVGLTSGVFPRAALAFDQGRLPQPLSGVGITVVQETVRERCSLTEDGKRAINEMRWTFYVRAQISQGGDGNSAYQARHAAELLRALLQNDTARKPIAEKGILNVRIERARVEPAVEFATRMIVTRGQLEYVNE